MEIIIETIPRNEETLAKDVHGIIIKSGESFFIIRELLPNVLTVVNPEREYQLDHVVRQTIEPYANGSFMLTQHHIRPKETL